MAQNGTIESQLVPRKLSYNRKNQNSEGENGQEQNENTCACADNLWHTKETGEYDNRKPKPRVNSDKKQWTV